MTTIEIHTPGVPVEPEIGVKPQDISNRCAVVIYSRRGKLALSGHRDPDHPVLTDGNGRFITDHQEEQAMMEDTQAQALWGQLKAVTHRWPAVQVVISDTDNQSALFSGALAVPLGRCPSWFASRLDEALAHNAPDAVAELDIAPERGTVWVVVRPAEFESWQA